MKILNILEVPIGWILLRETGSTYTPYCTGFVPRFPTTDPEEIKKDSIEHLHGHYFTTYEDAVKDYGYRLQRGY